MASKLLLVILTEFLFLKVSPSYYPPYPGSRYVVRDSRPQNSFTPDYSSYYPSYTTKVTKSPYQIPPQGITPLKRPTEYRQPTHHNAMDVSSQGVQRPLEFRPPMYPASLVKPPVQPSMEFQPQTYQKAVELFSPVTQKSVEFRPTYQRATESVIPPTQSLIEYRQPAYQKVAQAPSMQPVEFRAPVYQKADEISPQSRVPMEFQTPCQQTSELISTTIQTPTGYYQPAYQKVAEFVTNQRPIEYHQPTRSSDLTMSKIQSTQIPSPPSLGIESLNSLSIPKSECSPVLTSQAMEYIKRLGLQKSDCLSKSSTDTLDTNVLNNLAIALQLLIVNNIINHPRESVESASNLSNSLLDLLYTPELPECNSYSSTTASPCPMLNANFIGSSNFGDANIMSKGMLGLGSFGTGFPSPRPGSNLMSPYDAIAAYSASSSSTSPFSESTPSLFALKNDFQSPYAAIMAADSNKDLFSMADLF